MIRFEDVTKTYDGQSRPALKHVDLDIDSGEFVFLVGASGSGKSTFLRLILREYRPTSGHLFVAGKDLNKLPSWKIPALRRQIGTVFQDFRLLPGKTVHENVAFALQVIGKSGSVIKKVVPETLELVGLEGKENRLPEELSGGEQQRVAIAVGMANRPALLLADEPTGEVDNVSAEAIFHALRGLKEDFGVTVIVVTHDMTVATRVDRVVGMRDGRTSTEILRRRGGDVAIAEEEYAILDRAGRLQLPEAYIEALDMEDRVRLRLQQDHIGVWPEHTNHGETNPSGQEGETR